MSETAIKSPRLERMSIGIALHKGVVTIMETSTQGGVTIMADDFSDLAGYHFGNAS